MATDSNKRLKSICKEIKKLKDAEPCKYSDREYGLLIPAHNIADLKLLVAEYERMKENERVMRVGLANMRLELEASA